MAKGKTTKRALLASVLSVALCVAMLAGSTFAWFTDSVTSGKNNIQAGNLDVAMEWADGTEAPDAATWNDASTGAIFDYDLWEPGYTEVRHVRITNQGTLSLKYQISIIPNGTVSELAKVIDVYYIKGGQQISDRTDLDDTMKIGTLSDILAKPYAATGHLTAEAGSNVDIATIALKMQESAGNEYQGLSIGSDFSIQLLATQYTAESDSFDHTYDQQAQFPASPADISQQLASLTAGETLTLSEGVFDLGASSVVLPENVTIVGEGAGKTVLKGSFKFLNNVTIQDVTLEATAANNLLAVAGAGNTQADGAVITIEDSVISGYKYGAQLASGVKNSTLVIKNTVFDNVWCAISVKTMDADGVTPINNKYEITNVDFSGAVYQLQTFYPSLYYKDINGAGETVNDSGNWIQTVTPGTDTTVNGEALKNAVESVIDGGTVLVPAGEYTIPVLNIGDKEILIEGEQGATFARADEGFITVRGSSDAKLTVRGMNFQGTVAQDPTGLRGVCFSGQANENATLVVENCHFENLTTGIFLGGVANATIRNCTFINCFAGIGGTEDLSGTLTVSNCTFSGNSETIGWAGTGTLIITQSPTCESFNQYTGAASSNVPVSNGEYHS